MWERFDWVGFQFCSLSVRITSVCVLPNLRPVPLLFHRLLSQLQPVPVYFALVATFFLFCNVLTCNNMVPNP